MWAIFPLTPIVPSYLSEPYLVCCIFDRFTNTPANLAYVLSMSCCVFFVPTVLITYWLWKIFLCVKESSKKLSELQVSVFLKSCLKEKDAIQFSTPVFPNVQK